MVQDNVQARMEKRWKAEKPKDDPAPFAALDKAIEIFLQEAAMLDGLIPEDVRELRRWLERCGVRYIPELDLN